MKAGRRRLWAKLMTFVVLPVLLIVVLMLSVSIFAMRNIQVEAAKDSNRRLVDLMMGNYDEMYNSVISSINLITVDDTLQTLMTQSRPGTEAWLNDNRELRSLISDRTLTNRSVKAIYLYGTDGAMRTFWHRDYRLGSTVPIYPSFPEKWGDASGRVSNRMDRGELLFTRRILSRVDLRLIGYCLVIYDATSFNITYDDASTQSAAQAVLVNAQDEIIVHRCASGAVASAMVAVSAGEDGNRETAVEGLGKVILSSASSRSTHWRVVSCVPVPEIVQTSTVLIRTLVIVSLLSLILGAGICAVMARRWFVRPVREIGETLRAVEDGDYTMRVDIRTGDELEELGESINHMLQKTDSLINQGLRNELLQRESQLAALQAQINPHLLHNALECINWLAEFNRKDDIRRVTLALSRLMQSMTETPRMITIAQELDYTRSFLTIYDILLENRLHCTITDETDTGMLIPRMMIQPLVENAVIHGIKPSTQPGHIDISVSETDEGILISVFNDGVPMTEAQTAAINAYAVSEDDGSMLGVGLRNIIRRMHLLYGRSASLHCSSEAEWGTVFDLVLPYNDENTEMS